MTRPAIFQDIPAIEAMIREMYRASKYHGRVGIADKAMRSLLEAAVAGQNQRGPQASMVRIAEDSGPVGFMIGVLDRVYHIGDRLSAKDLYLYVRPGAKATHTFRLIDDYLAWARSIRTVIEINLSWTDALPGAERVAALYSRKGFTRIGEIYELRLDAADERIAA